MERRKKKGEGENDAHRLRSFLQRQSLMYQEQANKEVEEVARRRDLSERAEEVRRGGGEVKGKTGSYKKKAFA